MQPVTQSPGKLRAKTGLHVRRPPFVAWPGWRFLLLAWLLSLGNGLWFSLVYGGCNWITAQRTWRVPIHLSAELQMPFVPGMVSLYMSIYLLFLAGPFIIRERRNFFALNGALALTILLGGLGFLLVPAELQYEPINELGAWAGLFHIADRLNLTYNLLPSLHVALSVCCIAAFAARAPTWGRVALWTWAGLIALSTLLTHQHHILDVITGWAVGQTASHVAKPWSRASTPPGGAKRVI